MPKLRIGPTPQGFSTQPLNVSQAQTKRSLIDVKHQDWLTFSEAWFNTCLMYEGEPIIGKNAEKFLKRRPKEDSALFQHRLDLFTYENHLGTGLGYYEAQMFDEDPEIHLGPADPATGEIKLGSELSPEQNEAYNEKFLKNCDRAGTPLVDKFQKAFQHMLLYGAAWMLDDLPAPDADTAPTTLKEQKDRNLLDPYKVLYTPMDVINWEADEQGNLMWAIVFIRRENQAFLQKPTVTDRWTYYDQQQFKVYEQTYDKEDNEAQIKQSQDNTPVYLVAAGFHVLAQYNQVPLQRIELPTGWWLARRVYSTARAHINTTNVLNWSLHMAALAVPVIKTEMDLSQLLISEGGFIKLNPLDSYEYAEPEGKSWAELRLEKASLKEDMFRAMFLIAMARDTNATAAAQSGVSKQQDMAPSHVVLSGMGAVLRSAMQEAMARFIKVRATLPGCEGDIDLVPDVRGFQFEDKLTVEEIDVIQTILGLEIPSDLFEKELFCTAVRSFLKNANPERIKEIEAQINSSPTKEERDAAQMQQRADALRQNITSRLKDPVAKEESD